MKNHIISKWKVVVLALFLVFMALGNGIGQTVDYATMSRAELQKKIATLDLGLDTYIIGKALTKGQQAVAEKSSAYKSYPGTMKFKDKDTFVIIDQETKVVIALYVRNEQAKKEDFRAMVGELMMRFGEPTAEAHGKIIYWNYGPDGLISEELYRTVKGEGLLDSLAVLATVKFSSSQNVDVMSLNTEGKKQDEEKTDVTSDNYVMIQSDVLTKKYMGE